MVFIFIVFSLISKSEKLKGTHIREDSMHTKGERNMQQKNEMQPVAAGSQTLSCIKAKTFGSIHKGF